VDCSPTERDEKKLFLFANQVPAVVQAGRACHHRRPFPRPAHLEARSGVRSLGVVISHPDPGVVDELVHAVEASADFYLAIDRAGASVVLAGERELDDVATTPAPEGTAVVGLAADHDVAAIARAALRVGAQGIVCWPRDATDLTTILREASSRARLAAGRTDGRVIAVAGARGGAGTTTVVAMMARAVADAALVDLDAGGGGQEAFLAEGAEPTLGDLLGALDDFDPSSLARAFAAHASGRAICGGPRDAGPDTTQTKRLVALLRSTVPVTFFDLGRARDSAAVEVLTNADVVVCVCAPDVGSMRGARALIDAAGSLPRVVLNRSARMRLSPRDVKKVLGEPPSLVIPDDPAVRRAGEAGRLPARGPARRAIDRFATRLLAEVADGS
jgi:pilus assembly protein CpaE